MDRISSDSSVPLAVLDGKYQLLRQLGVGGMGAVYEARHGGTGRRVAVKVIAGEALVKSADMVERFQREAMASGAIESQYIANVMDTGVDPATGSPYMVMELLVGEDLEHAAKRLGPMPADLALRVVAQACLGLQKAHEAGVIHRDVKPANLYLTRRDGGELVVKLVDFGIAKMKADQVTSTEGKSLTRTGSMVGSPVYMSPEQAFGKKDVDHRTDVWSLGVVLYECLTGATPHGDADTVGALLVRICSMPAPLIQERAPWVSPEVAAVVHRALALDPEARFASAAEMYAAVKALLPGGHALDESMLVPLPEAARQSTARRLSLPEAVRLPSPSSGDLSHLMSSAGTSTQAMGQTTAGLGSTNGGATSKLAPVLPAVIAVVVVVGLCAGGWMLASRSKPGVVAGSPAGLVAPPSWSAPSASAEPPPPPPEARTVRVVVLPAGVTAEVDGVSTAVSDGAVPVKGSLGSKHHVRVSSGGRDKTVEVVVAEDGPVPPMVDLGPAPAKEAPKSSRAPAPKPSNPLEMQMQ